MILNPQVSGIVKRIFTTTPKKPSSGNIPVLAIMLNNGKMVILHIPGGISGVTLNGAVLLSHRTPRLGVKYSVIRGVKSLKGLETSKQLRSKFGLSKKGL